MFWHLSVCLSTGGVPHLRSKVGGYPISGLRWGVCHLRSGGYPISGLGGTLAKSGGTPARFGGYPIPGLGVTHPRVGVPQPGLGGYPISGLGGTLTRSGWGVPRYPPTLRWDTPPPRQISIASTCYAAGGMPLAFTQEDFLVYNFKSAEQCNCLIWNCECCGGQDGDNERIDKSMEEILRPVCVNGWTYLSQDYCTTQ